MKMRNLKFIPYIFLLLLTGCDKSNIDVQEPVVDVPIIDTVRVESFSKIAEMTNDFGWKLFQEVAKGIKESNVLVSPLSVQTALSMAVNGADGATANEMLDVLGCAGCNVKDLNLRTAQLRELMEEQSGHPRLISANGVFYDPDRIDVLESFIQTVTNDYRAGFREYDFGDPSTKDKINQWVLENTDGKIDKIIDKINGNDIAFLINALHFKADWAIGFHPSMTKTGIFTTAQNTEVSVDYVSADHKFTTATRDSFNLVDLPFKDSTYTLSLIQPTENLATQPDWFSHLKASDLRDMWSSMSFKRAIVSFPKLNIEYEEELKDALIRMGIKEAFSEFSANFSNLGQSPGRIYMSKVSHKAVLKVDEKGAEGAAVTSVGISYTSSPPVFTYNRPFVIVLRHTSTNTILFAGLVNDPS